MHKGDYLAYMSTIYTKLEMDQIICTLWRIWTERNRVVHGHIVQPVKMLASFATNYLQNYISAQTKFRLAATRPPQQQYTSSSAQQQPHRSTEPIPWQPPSMNAIKLNVDAALESVARDSLRQVVAALSKPIIKNFASRENRGQNFIS
uniref:Uncharacterized protein n=1 Tax=Cannabis sativa TaxID=3483 RepID=A0A803P2I1_CANSA